MELATSKYEDLINGALMHQNNYHAKKKVIDPQLILQAQKNKPFENILNNKFKGVANFGDFDESCRVFLLKQFPRLVDLEIDFNINTTLEKDQEKLTKTIELYKTVSLAIADDYKIDWDTLNTVKYIFLFIRPHSLQESFPGSPIYHLLNFIRDNFGNSKDKNVRYSSFLKIVRVIDLYKEKEISDFPIILDKKNLAEIVAACPVFYGGKNQNETSFSKYVNPRSNLNEFFELFNRGGNSLFLDHYNGDDLIPLDLLDLFPSLKQIFSGVFFATPYFNNSNGVFESSNWVSNIDPFCLGLDSNLPNHFFVLRRWSKGGIFPLVDEMIADTMDYLEVNTTKIDLISRDFNYNILNSNRNRDYIKLIINRYIDKYKEGLLISTLRENIVLN